MTIKVFDQKVRLGQLEDAAAGKMALFNELEDEKANLRSQLETYKTNIEHLSNSLAAKREKKQGYKRQVMELQERVNKGPQPPKLEEDEAYISMKEKLEIAIERLNRGERRIVRKVRRSKKGMGIWRNAQLAREEDGFSGSGDDLTDESYYEGPEPNNGRKETKDEETATLDLSDKDDGRSIGSDQLDDDGFGAKGASLPLDMLSNKEYFNVMKSVGAIPKSNTASKLRHITEEEASKITTHIETWFGHIFERSPARKG